MPKSIMFENYGKKKKESIGWIKENGINWLPKQGRATHQEIQLAGKPM